MANTDYYGVLGVGHDASEKEIKNAYRKLAKEWHPDKFATKSDSEKAEAESKFKEIGEAYRVLSDKDLKAKYDRFGTVDEQEIASASNPFSGFGSPFDSFMGGFGMGKKRSGPSMPPDIMAYVDIDIKDFFSGGRKKVSVRRTEKCSHCHGSGAEGANDKTTCPYCNGQGMIVHTERRGFLTRQTAMPCEHCHGTGTIIKNPCKHCGGNGVVSVNAFVDVGIPLGYADGMYMILDGEGNESPEGLRGRLIINYRLNGNGVFSVVVMEDIGESPDAIMYDVLMETQIPIPTCLLGGKFRITGPDGKDIEISVPKNVKPNSILNVKKKGLPKRDGSYGNLLVRVSYKRPSDISKEEEDLIRRLSECKNFSA